MSENGYRVLVKEKIADAGVDLLRSTSTSTCAPTCPPEELSAAIGDYDAIVIRSATNVDADLIERAGRLKVIGRAGIGVDNVDVPAATKRGIIVANAPESNIIAAAEHTIAMLLAQVRNIPQAHSSLKSGKWERSRFGGVEVFEKTLGILGFGRIGQLVAERAKSFGMVVTAYDPFVAAERYRELGVERAETPEALYERADFITIHLPKTEETLNYVNAAAFAQMKDGVRIVNCARGELVDLERPRGGDRVRQGGGREPRRVPGRAGHGPSHLRPRERGRHPPPGRVHGRGPGPRRRDHRRAGGGRAERRAGLERGQHPEGRQRGHGGAGALPDVSAQLGRLAMSLAQSGSVDRLEISYRGHLAERDTRLLTVSVLNGAFSGVAENVNFVNAPAIAEERGIRVSELKESESRDYANLVSVATVADGQRVEVAGTTIGPRHRPHLVSAYGQSFNIELMKHLAVFRYSDVPGMIGKIGTVLGEHGINVASTAVGREPDHEPDSPAGGGSGATR